MHSPRLLLLLAALLLSLTALACSGDDDHSIPLSPEIAAIEAFANRMESNGNLRPPVPHYLPAGVDPEPREQSDLTADHIVVDFQPALPPGAPGGAETPFVTIVANLEPDGVQPCASGPPPTPWGAECLTIKGEPSLLEVTPSPSQVQAFVATRLGDLSVFVIVQWPATSDNDIVAGGQARAEALLVTESLSID